MSVRRCLVLAAAVLALTALLAAPATGASGASASAHHGKGKKCRKGYKLKTVTKHGKKVKVCKKQNPSPPQCRATASCAIPAPAPHGLFEAPGRKLENDEAKAFVARYLPNSTFTDCPAGWPNCSVEQRYSHAAPNVFHYCRLTPTSGSDIRVTDEWGLEGAIVEPDGSWTVRERVYDYGHYPVYEWHVAANGVVNGAYAFPGNAVEQIGPLQYLSGAKDCSY